MSWELRKKAQALLALEQGGIVKDWGGKISVALVYPNTYSVGMSNLGFQTVYAHLNRLPDVVCERVFFPDPEDLDEYLRTRTPPFSLETQRPLSDFHLVGFSVTYEGDYINVLRLLSMAGIPGRPQARRPQDPLILMGGVCAFANPEPIAPFMDFVVVGEGEEIVGEIVAAYREAFEGLDPAGHKRDAFLDRLASIQGIYLPHAYEVRHADDGSVKTVVPRHAHAPPVVVKRRLKDVNQFEKIVQDGKRVGLVGACVSDYPWIGELMTILEEHGVEVSISSLRADSLTEGLVRSLKRGGHRTLTMAPEAGTERLRQVIRKAISDEQLYAACHLVRRHGIPNLKCYFMIGLPTETREDIEAIPDLAGRLLDRLRVPDPDGHPFGKLTLSISSFVPKPWTPFQWAPFDQPRNLEEKLGIIKRGVARFSNVRVLHENPREAFLQALLARGDRRVGEFLGIAGRLGGDWRKALREWEGDPAFYTTRARPLDEVFPWDHLDVGVKKAGLIREYQKAGLDPVAADV